MGKTKRSERPSYLIEHTAVATREQAPEMVRSQARDGRSVVSAFCPVCARTVPERRVTKRAKVGALETKPYFESIEWQPDHPFGLRLSAAGKGSFKNWGYIGPEESPELFGAMQVRFLEALKEWIAKGWLTEGDVLAALGEVRGPGKASQNGNGSRHTRKVA